MTKIRTKTINCNSYKDNCEDFLISHWILRKAEENFSFSAQTSNHFKDEVYHLLNFVQKSITNILQKNESNNLSKFPSSAFFSSENCVGDFI